MPAQDFNNAVDRIKAELKRIWEDPEFKYKCCKVKIKFVYSNAAAADVDDKNLNAANGVSSQSGLGPNQSTGTWFIGDPNFAGVAAHEVGHELGMTDKYECFDAAGNKINCYNVDASGNLVLNPAYAGKRPPAGYPNDGIAFDRNGTPKQQDIDEIVRAVGVDCPERCCNRCMIARSARGTALESRMDNLRLFRDRVVLRSWFAPVLNAFLSLYYLNSPKFVKQMDKHKSVRFIVTYSFAFPFIVASSGLVNLMDLAGIRSQKSMMQTAE